MHITSVSLLQDYFSAKGYSFEPMALGQSEPRRFVTIQSPNGAYLTLAAAMPTYPFATTAAAKIFDDKIKAYDLAKRLNVNIPATCIVTTEAYDTKALQAMLSTHKTLIVKPHDSLQSRGLTAGITRFEQLTTAIERAAEISSTVLVQQQVAGEELRFIALNGAIRSVLLRQKPFVIGDGAAAIAELINRENEARRAITNSKVNYPQLDARLIAPSLLTSTRVPSAGERVELNTKTMIRDGASIYDVVAQVHPSYLDTAQRLTERFGKGFVAADLMIEDYTQPATSDNYAMLELNGAISLPMCYSCRDGKHFRIIEDHLGPMLEQLMV